MQNQSTNLPQNPPANNVPEDTEKPQEIRVVIEPPAQKPTSPQWWDVLGWLLRFIIAVATLLKLLKDK